MISPVHTAAFSLPPVRFREVLRYAGAKEETPALAELLEDALAEAQPLLRPMVCWQEFPVSRDHGVLKLGFTSTGSKDLMKNLSGCHQLVLFGATLGLPLDRLITRYSRLSPARALLLQAIGAERIEALCDVFCEKIHADAHSAGYSAAPRFSPGYGDFPLEVQRDIFRTLDCSRRIGLTLNESLLMSPSKSVTAIIGIGNRPIPPHTTGCSQCSKTDCIHRRLP